ncbi:hypothetical protein TRFO_12211 [Tritrichomonas foetus]|uniref:Uncharacterized protein n=1 Tax=Tritrichomonas foetus TaxID=1144522 RepID=A0A1J4J5X2_9EUKA|nr:hypothetical protein TRFO_12211 [Tritrichomonas foetus]|eukprot:OHS92853.1 hypothetical protein TRFO_12211 [Tritrichomonas foetus]
MEIEGLLNSLNENFRRFSSPQDLNSYNQAKSWRKSIISNRQNIFLFVQIFLNSHLSPECQIFVLKMIREMIDAHLNSIQLTDITLSFTTTRPEIVSNIAVINTLGDIIGYCARLIYQNEKKFLFGITDDVINLSLLQWVSFYNAIDYIDNPRTDCTDSQNKDISKTFKKDFLLQFFRLSLRSIDGQPAEAIHLLLRCIQFDSKVNFPFMPVDEVTAEILKTMSNPTIFDKLFEFISNCPPPISSDALCIIGSLMQTVTQSSVLAFMPLFDLSITFCSRVLTLGEVLKDDRNVNAFKFVLSSFPKNSMVNMKCESINYELVNFIINNLTQNYRLAVSLLPQACAFFEKIQFYLSRNSPIFELYSNFLETFIRSTIDVFQTSDLESVYDVLFADRTERTDTKTIIKTLLRISNVKKTAVLSLVNQMIEEISQRPFNMAVNCQVGFLLFIARIAFKENSPMEFDGAFKSFLFTNDKLLSFKQIMNNRNNQPIKNEQAVSEQFMYESSVPFPLEYFSLSFMKSFLKKFVGSTNLAETMPNLHPLFESPELVVVFIFQRFWNDMLNNICPEKARKCLRQIVDNSQNMSVPSCALQIIASTNFPQRFLDNYISFPCSSAIYYTIVNVMILSDEIRPRFFESFEANFVGKTDSDSLKRLFKILSSWFLSARQPNRWLTLYLYFYSRFLNMCKHISTQNPEFAFLLKFIYKMTKSMPISTPFSTNEPHSFILVQTFMELLQNITATVGQHLNPIQIDENIFDMAFMTDLFDSKPISLSEAHSIGLHERQLKIKKRNSQTGKSVNDEEHYWSFLPLILESANEIIKSSIPNFGIMRLYNDYCILNLYNQLITTFSKTPILSILSDEILTNDLSTFIFLLSSNFRDELVSNENFWIFTVKFFHVSFLSHQRDVLKTTCQSLYLIIKGFSKPEEVTILRNHFILAFNVALYCVDCSTAAEFILEFARIDPDFVRMIGNLIEENLLPEVRQIFHDQFSHFWDGLADQTLEKMRQQLSANFKNFLDSIAQYSIKLYSLPNLAEFFDFTSI